SSLVRFDQINSLCDIGTGAGFPGIPSFIDPKHLKHWSRNLKRSRTFPIFPNHYIGAVCGKPVTKHSHPIFSTKRMVNNRARDGGENHLKVVRCGVGEW
ncbi:MAG: class I SAM-dependent methyltransferase, partial [Sweet potato little leaf phytoplasma]|nr:class I SAM-dependent methyltransferase [Sweet potato little leaf phytoplasma]